MSLALSVNIPGVAPTTRLADLTVGQFLDLLSQVSSQLSISRRFPDPKDMEDAIAEVGKAIAGVKQGLTGQEAIHTARQMVTSRTPEALGTPSRDGGISPAAREP